MNKSSLLMLVLSFSVILLAIVSFNSVNVRLSEQSSSNLMVVTSPIKILSDECGGRENVFGSYFPQQNNNLQPGNCCTAHNQCWSGNCACSRGGSASLTRCCHLDNRKSCNNDAECQSNVCDAVTGRCVNNPTTGGNNRPSGSACSVHEDCASGFCSISTLPGGVVTYTCT